MCSPLRKTYVSPDGTDRAVGDKGRRAVGERGRMLATNWSTWVEMFLGLAEIGLLVAAVYLTIAQFTRSRASMYIERFNSSDAMESRVAVDRWLEAHVTAKARLEELERDPALRTHLRRFTNLFQELGAAYQFGVAHRKTVRVLFDALVVMYWERLRFWVEDYRANSDPTLYSRFEYLYNEIRTRERKTRPRLDYVVAYGSLMNPASLSAGLGRDASIDELIPIEVVDWERRWTVGETVRLSGAGQTTTAAFLNLEPSPGQRTAAAMIRVSRSELARLTVREKNYDARDLRDAVRLIGGRRVGPGAAVWCFVGQKRHRVIAGDDDVVVLEEYVSKVEQAAERIDPTMIAELRASVAAAGFEPASGPYQFADPDQRSLV